MEDVLSVLADALHRPIGRQQQQANNLCDIIERLGGACLFASLLRREQPSLRVLGLQILSALTAHRSQRSGAVCFIS